MAEAVKTEHPHIVRLEGVCGGEPGARSAFPNPMPPVYCRRIPSVCFGAPAMTITVEATYENGQLKFKRPLVLADGTPVRVTITPLDEVEDPLAGVIGIGEGPPDGADNHDHYIYGTPKRP
jgi:predicted DNA-binding antitoxin AbrB/MazE fold protein